jgi:hypothetical protein
MVWQKTYIHVEGSSEVSPILSGDRRLELHTLERKGVSSCDIANR